MSGWWTAVIVALSVAANGFFAGSETGFTTASRVRVLHEARRKRRGAQLAARLLRHRESVIVTALVGNNLAVVVGSAMATAAFLDLFGPRGESWAAVLMAALNIVFGEVLPKSYFRSRPESSSIAAAPWILLSQWLLSPLRWVALVLSQGVLFLLHIDPRSSEVALTRERVLRTLRSGTDESQIDEEEQDILSRMVRSSRLPLHRLCTPMSEVASLPEDATVADALALVRERGHSRLPLRDASGQIHGLVSFRDLLGRSEDTPVIGLIRQLLRLDGKMGLDEGILAFTTSRASLAVVVDDGDRPWGILTLEDLIEPLVGEIVDEHDRPEAAGEGEGRP